jgi:hypothetical protein
MFLLTKHILCHKNFLKIKHIIETKIKTKEHNRQNINIGIRNLDTNKREIESN